MEATQSSLTDEWLGKLWYIHTMNYSELTLKRKEILQYATTWMNSEGLMLREINQSEGQILYDPTYMKYLEYQTHRHRKWEG